MVGGLELGTINVCEVDRDIYKKLNQALGKYEELSAFLILKEFIPKTI